VDKFLLIRIALNPNLEPTEPITLRVLEAFTPMINRLGREPDYLPPSCIYVKKNPVKPFGIDPATFRFVAQISLFYHRLQLHVYQFLTNL
jgi:hypothetical protein